jgi:hypothetical protein
VGEWRWARVLGSMGRRQRTLLPPDLRNSASKQRTWRSPIGIFARHDILWAAPMSIHDVSSLEQGGARFAPFGCEIRSGERRPRTLTGAEWEQGRAYCRV